MKCLAVLILFGWSLASAKIFNMKDTTLAGYLTAQYAESSVGTDFFEGESSATDYSKGFKKNIGTDFGLIYRTHYFAWIFGFEFIKPDKLKNAVASTAGTQNYNYSSEISYLAPKVGLELFLYNDNSQRISLQGSVGTASLSTKTDYSAVTIAPNSDFTIEGKGAANLLNVSLGSEWHWIDNTALQLQVGYRALHFKKIKAATDVASSFQGAITKGTRLNKLDGSALDYNFSGYFVNLSMRIWIF